MSFSKFDYIIVGAGSAGCVLANRLSENPSNLVCLIEAGPKDSSPWIHLPIGYGKTMWDPKLNWKLETEPDPGVNHRKVYWPRGKTLGGSSSINGLIFIRGQKEDYEHWKSLGNSIWGWDDVLPYFKKAEGNDSLSEPLHSQDGPLKATTLPLKHPLVEAFIQTGNALGIPSTQDFNSLNQEGVGYYQLTTHKGLRCSSAVAYLNPIKHRKNLHILTNAQVSKVIFDQTRAAGIEFLRDGKINHIYASNEVILSAGSIQSPQLLQLSGIGDARLLNQHQVPVVHHLPGVGQNLQDHLQYRLIYELNQKISTNDLMNSYLSKLKMLTQWLIYRGGPLSIGINQGGLFTRVMPHSLTPDIQFHLATLSADMAGGKVHDFSGFTMSVCQLRPTSRGKIEIKSSNPLDLPAIHPNYLSTQEDIDTSIAAVKFARLMSTTNPLKNIIKKEITPENISNDEDILNFCRNNGATIFHPTGTCKMGPDNDSMSVLDESLKVRGVQNLRVVDCSAMPTVTSGNTNWPVIMMAEKASDLILQQK